MPSINIIRETKIIKTPRVMQLEGIFDIPPSEKSAEQWNIDFDLPLEWNIGLIIGPSGCGKTTIARELFGENIVESWNWTPDKSILDDFPKDISIKEILNTLSSVGFSSAPSWVRPFRVLSNGEQFRVNMARTILECKNLAVVDEFTSIVDRTVAQIGSAAIQKAVRRRNQKFIAVSCHYDIVDWLEPDWVYQPHINQFHSGRYLHQRPKIALEIQRVNSSAWNIFRKHHYLDTNLNKSSVCFVAFYNDVPVAFCAVLHFPHPSAKNIKREHRLVCLPDFQGVGIGNYLSDYIGAMCKSLGYRYISDTSNPAIIGRRAKSEKWIMKQQPTIKRSKQGETSTVPKNMMMLRNRFVASFEYIGSPLDKFEAEHVWNIEKLSSNTTDKQL